MAESDKQLALRALRETLASGAARPAERVRAAEALLRAEADDLGQAADMLEATDAELLALARGETGVHHQLMGPVTPPSVAVPSHAVQPPGLVLPAQSIGHGDERNRGQANPFLKRGPKEDPAKGHTRGAPSGEGPKTDPAIRDTRGAVSGQFESVPENGQDPDPWT